MEVSKVKIAVLVIILGAAGYFGWRWMQDDAKNSKDEDLFTKYTITPLATGQPPYNQELHFRVKSGKMPWADLVKIAKTGREPEKQVAYRVMYFAPFDKKDDVVKLVEAGWKSDASTEVKKQMIVALEGAMLYDKVIGDGGKGAIEFLIKTVLTKEASTDVTADAMGLLKNVCQQQLHDKDKWLQWYNTGGSQYKIKNDMIKPSTL